MIPSKNDRPSTLSPSKKIELNRKKILSTLSVLLKTIKENNKMYNV